MEKQIKQIVLISLITLITISSFLGERNNLLPTISSTYCNEHFGYHYELLEPDTSKSGHMEFWCCCKCHEIFLNEPTSGVFYLRSDSEMNGVVDENHPAYLAKLENPNQDDDNIDM